MFIATSILVVKKKTDLSHFLMMKQKEVQINLLAILSRLTVRNDIT
jgi:hypothetical protein